MVFYNHLDFLVHLKVIINKTSNLIGNLQVLQKKQPQTSLIMIYKSFIRPYLDYRSVTCCQFVNSFFRQKLEYIHQSADLVLTEEIKGTSIKNLFKKSGLQSLQQRQWYRKLFSFYIISKYQAPSSLYCLIHTPNNAYRT